MRNIIRIIAGAALAVSLAFVFFGVRFRYTYAASIDRVKEKSYTYLFIGFDEAAKNTDVLCLVNYTPETSETSVVQIPRDTYCRFGGSQNKINQYYPYLLSRGNTDKAAMEELVALMESQFGVEIDGYVGIDPKTLVAAVDALGGIDAVFERDLVLKNGNETVKTFKKGKKHLSGAESLLLVRHRAGYAGGDIQRLDAQKIFIKGLVSTLKTGVGLPAVMRLAKSAGSGLQTNISFYRAAKLFFSFKNAKDISLTVNTLLGEAIKDTTGVWYYVLSKKSASEMISEHFYTDKELFDKNKLFTNPEKAEFEKIYYAS